MTLTGGFSTLGTMGHFALAAAGAALSFFFFAYNFISLVR